MPGMSGLEFIRPFHLDPAFCRATVMMVTSPGLGQVANCYRELGVTRLLKKPILQADLLQTVLRVLGRFEEVAPVSTQVQINGKMALPILLAEDNAINQRVATALLEKMGHSVVVAADGQKALQALATESFDLVLMDIQMPEMDGFAARAAIRSQEQLTGKHISVIAMTANAVKLVVCGDGHIFGKVYGFFLSSVVVCPVDRAQINRVAVKIANR
jgi:CheY-like chemotaxis protein